MDRKLFNRFLLIVACLLFAAYYIYPPYPLPLVDIARKHLSKSDPQIEAILNRAAEAPLPQQYALLKGGVADQGLDLREYFGGIAMPQRIRTVEEANRAILIYLQRQASPKITLGLDLQGGTSFLVKLETGELQEQQYEVVQQQAIEILRKRIDRFGVSEPIIQPVGKDRINVQIPGLSEQQRLDARTQIEKVAKLEFRLVHPRSTELLGEGRIPPGYEKKFERRFNEKTGEYENIPLIVTVRTELTGKSLSQAYVSRDELGQYAIGFELTGDGAKKFAALTRAHIGEQLAILMDGEVKSAPSIRTEISGRGEITGGPGGFSPEEAFELTGVLNNPLETPVEILQVQSVEPSLGADSIQSGIRAGIISLVLVAIFMGLFYLRAGLIANAALALNVILLIGVLATFQFTLTLPGVAALVLTVGIAVDANVLVFERIREYLNAGQDLRIAVREGFSRVFGTIIDANMTTLITALVLSWLGSGPVQGFGVVLSVGICTSVFCALVVTRFLIDLSIYKLGMEKLAMLSIIRDTKIDFLQWRWAAAVVSAVLILGGVGSMASKGKSGFLGVDFIGGDAITLVYKQRVPVAQIRETLNKAGSTDNTIQYQADNQLFIKTQYEKGELAVQTLQSAFSQAGLVAEQIERVGPTVGRELTQKAVWSLAIAALGILLYITARFEFAYAVGAIVALLHDVLITLGIFVLFGRELTLPAIGALLTIGGYSLNDTVVVFDRIREEVRMKGDRLEFSKIINFSVNRVLGRTLLTSLTTLIASVCLLIFGGGVINDFALILVIGVITGTYSSVFIAAPILLFWHPSHLKPQVNVTATQAELRA